MKKMLFKRIFNIFILLIAFFSININSNAASFEYKDFNWNELLEKNKEYWVSICDEGDNDCVDQILETQEKFYTNLYKLLTKYQNKGYTIDDDIIIETIFFGLTPNTFNDPGFDEYDSFNVDEEDGQSFIAEILDKLKAKKYFEEETDSLKTLMNNMLAYKERCYGISDSKPKKDEEGNYYCEDGLVVDNGECISDLGDVSSNYFSSIGLYNDTDFYKFSFINKLFIFTQNKISENESKCKELATEKSLPKSRLSDTKAVEVNEEIYWEFLKKSNWFDKKKHLQGYFKPVLNKTNHNNMTELTPKEYEEQQSLIQECRQIIIDLIKSILETHSRYKSDVSLKSKSENKPAYWWPIGSTETTESDGKIFASGDPESIGITSKYGPRNGKNHNGIDIGGTLGTTNIIASMAGTVVYAPEEDGGKCVDGDEECGGGYGNYVILQHTDGNYTLYAHMHTDTITVKKGDTVNQGQVIGKMGNTGRSTGPHLHFEIRVGGNDSSSTQDPLNFISETEPRKIGGGATSEFHQYVMNMEAGKMNKSKTKYIVFDAEGGGAYRSFGAGIVVEFNSDVIIKHGLTPSSLQYGTEVDKNVADEIFYEVIQQHIDSVKRMASKNGLNLTEKQIQGLASHEFNAGNTVGFANAFKKYGATQALCDNWWASASCCRYAGLPKRRKADCDLFVYGIYDMNVYD